MSTALAFDNDWERALNTQQVRVITRAPRASMLEEITKLTRIAAVVVENHWQELPHEIREVFRQLARDTMEPPPVGIWRRLQAAYLVLAAGPNIFAEYVSAFVKLQSALLDAIEREHPDYTRKMAEVVTEALDSTPPAMTPQEFREWLRTPEHPSAGRVP